MALSMPKYEPKEHEWRTKAACRDTDPALFFPVGTTGLAVDQVQSAKRVCLTCPCATECLQFALDTHQDAGVWGGLDEEERRVIRRRRRAAKREKRLREQQAKIVGERNFDIAGDTEDRSVSVELTPRNRLPAAV